MGSTTSQIDPRSSFFIAPDEKWSLVDESLIQQPVIGVVSYRKRNQDIYVRLKHFSYEAESRMTGGIAMLPVERIEALQPIVQNLQRQLKNAGAYGLIGPREKAFVPKKPKPVERVLPKTSAIIESASPVASADRRSRTRLVYPTMGGRR